MIFHFYQPERDHQPQPIEHKEPLTDAEKEEERDFLDWLNQQNELNYRQLFGTPNPIAIEGFVHEEEPQSYDPYDRDPSANFAPVGSSAPVSKNEKNKRIEFHCIKCKMLNYTIPYFLRFE